MEVASVWPDASNYNVIVAAVAARSRALHLRAWNEKAHAADLALRTLITLAGQIRAESARASSLTSMTS